MLLFLRSTVTSGSSSSGSYPTLTFEVAFTDNPGVVSPTWTDLSVRMLELVTERGRQMELDQTETGVMSTRLRNQDVALDPLNTSSSYYPNVVPVRQARLRATVLSTTYDVFRGDIPDWPQDWQRRENTVPLSLVDGFDALQNAEFTISRPVEYSGARVAAILDAAGWPSGMRQIDTGQSLLQALDYENANALQALQDVASWEYGVVFINASGNVVFHNRHRRLLDTTLRVTLSNDPGVGEYPLSDAKLVYRRERIRNSVSVTQNGGSAYTAEDTTSQTKYRRRSLSQTVYLSNGNEVQSMAEYLRDTFKDPVVRVEEVMIEPQQDDLLWPQALGREIGDRIRVKIRAPGAASALFNGDVIVEGVTHDANGPQRRWQTTFRCSPANAVSYWILDTSHLAVDTRLGF